jgi:hypothetical protein
MTVLLLTVLLFADDQAVDSVAALKPILAKLERERTEPRVGEFARKKWHKRQFRVVNGTIKHEVEMRLDDPKLPYKVRVTFEAEAFATPNFATKEEAEAAKLPKVPQPTDMRFTATFAWRDGRWQIEHVGATQKNGLPISNTKTARENKAPVFDFYFALGGK